MVNVLGNNKTEIARRLFAGDTSGMGQRVGWMLDDSPAYVGQLDLDLPALPPISADMRPWQSRNNQVLYAAYQQIEATVERVRQRVGAERIGVVLGTSTSGVSHSEAAHRIHQHTGSFPDEFHYNQQEMGNSADFLARVAQVGGPSYAISTACTSSANAFISARALLQTGLCDAVLVGGVDTLCRMTVQGFASLESTSIVQTNPLSRHRCGINIGEGAALMLATRADLRLESSLGMQGPMVALYGGGESNDAYHMSAPDPTGMGAQRAMQAALNDACLQAPEITYVNLHATATPKNDAMESIAMHAVFPEGVPCSGTKPLTGHTLGAAGVIEAGFCWLTLNAQFNPNKRLPPHIWDGAFDPELPPLSVVQPGQTFSSQTAYCMSNSFAFGGSNASLIFGVA
jgi:3-oxoacyl-[acyl-carrier-protein] synthase-1